MPGTATFGSTINSHHRPTRYHRLFSGAMLGIRNPVTHEFNWVDSPDVALELLVFAQHLMRKAKAATLKAPATAKTTAGAAA
ncbi:MAG: TIGR02391 family protein [Caulobacteraceae bacterium]|nr:TIGR02391 family protein [Caulobacteraceae bacterium]